MGHHHLDDRSNQHFFQACLFNPPTQHTIWWVAKQQPCIWFQKWQLIRFYRGDNFPPCTWDHFRLWPALPPTQHPGGHPGGNPWGPRSWPQWWPPSSRANWVAAPLCAVAGLPTRGSIYKIDALSPIPTTAYCGKRIPTHARQINPIIYQLSKTLENLLFGLDQ